MRKSIFIILSLLLPAILCAASQDANAVMRRAAANILTSRGITSTFTVTGEYDIKGTAKISGKKFSVTTGQNSVWYNGKKMATYNAKTSETVINVPDEEELAEVNPLQYIAGWERMFTATMASRQPKTGCAVLLKPKTQNSGIKLAVITFDNNYWPRRIVMRTSSGAETTITIISLRNGISHSSGSFEYPRKQYPKAKIINY